MRPRGVAAWAVVAAVAGKGSKLGATLALVGVVAPIEAEGAVSEGTPTCVGDHVRAAGDPGRLLCLLLCDSECGGFPRVGVW